MTKQELAQKVAAGAGLNGPDSKEAVGAAKFAAGSALKKSLNAR